MMPIVPISRPVIVRLLALVLILGLLGLFLLDLELPQEFYELKNAVSSRRKSSSSSKLGPHRLKIHLLPQAFKGINIPQAHSSFNSSRVLLGSSFETTIPHNATIHGFNVFDNLVMHNGTYYLVTSNRSSFPERANIARLPHRPGLWGERDPHEDVRTSLLKNLTDLNFFRRIFILLPLTNLCLYWVTRQFRCKGFLGSCTTSGSSWRWVWIHMLFQLKDIHTHTHTKALLSLVGWNHLRRLESLFTRRIWLWRKFSPGVVTITGSLSHPRKNARARAHIWLCDEMLYTDFILNYTLDGGWWEVEGQTWNHRSSYAGSFSSGSNWGERPMAGFDET